MKKTLQECKEIVAKQYGIRLTQFTIFLADLANKMYYEQLQNERQKAEDTVLIDLQKRYSEKA